MTCLFLGPYVPLSDMSHFQRARLLLLSCHAWQNAFIHHRNKTLQCLLPFSRDKLKIKTSELKKLDWIPFLLDTYFYGKQINAPTYVFDNLLEKKLNDWICIICYIENVRYLIRLTLPQRCLLEVKIIIHKWRGWSELK